MEQSRYLISDAAKKVKVESHVLRYWEEELDLSIKRNELGHRYYTTDDIERFIKIKTLKEQGFQLKAIHMILANGSLTQISSDGSLLINSDIVNGNHKMDGNKQESLSHETEVVLTEAEQYKQEKEARRKEFLEEDQITEKEKNKDIGNMSRSELQLHNYETNLDVDKQEKSIRLQYLLKQMISEAVRENNVDLCDDIKSSVLKELDYQFRMQEEREEDRETERIKREEEHYKKFDELIRIKSKKKDKRKKHSIF